MGLRNSIIYLAKNIKLDKNYRSVLNYSENDLINLITNNNNLVYSANDYSFLRDTGTIQVKASYSTVCQANYMAFKNQDYSNKWFFAFIDEVIYKGDACTEIRYTIDKWSTWFSYWSAKACYVVREHVVDDTIGANTVSEGLDVGDYIINSVDYVCYDVNTDIIVSVSDLNITGDNNTHLKYYEDNNFGRVFQGEYYFLFTGNDKYQNAKRFITMYDLAGKGDAISSVFMIPGTMTNRLGSKENNTITYTNTWTGASVTCTYTIFKNNGAIAIETDKQVSINTTLNGYSPKNNKLFVYPYNCLEVTNNSGGSNIYQYEQFINNQPRFNVYGVVTPGCSIRLVPLYYNKISEHQPPTQDGILYGYNDGINLGKLPVGSWKSDVYINWLTQNGVNQTWGMIKNSVSAITSAGSGNYNGIGGGVMGIVDSLVNNEQRQVTPDSAKGNTNNGDVCFATYSTMFQINKKSVRYEFARIIDDYFTRQGYKINRIKVPNMSHRQNYNFVQIANEDNVAVPNNYNNICPPATDLEEINNLFRRGVTIWNNHTNLGDYSVSNNITN